MDDAQVISGLSTALALVEREGAAGLDMLVKAARFAHDELLAERQKRFREQRVRGATQDFMERHRK